MIDTPVWFQDKEVEPVRELLMDFIHQLNKKPMVQRSRSPRRRLAKDTFPELFDYSNTDDREFIWACIHELSQAPYELFASILPELCPEKPLSLQLSPEAEPIIRQWMDMPQIAPDQVAWAAAVSAWSESLDKDNLLQLGYPGVYSCEKILAGLTSISQEGFSQSKTWRQWSAQYFEEDSKYLDNMFRRQWLIQVIPGLEKAICHRPLLLNVHLVAGAKGFLIIENQDTFLWLQMKILRHELPISFHLVFGKGFVASAGRVRSEDSVRFFWDGEIGESDIFRRHWLDENQSWPSYFWGDLDFSGLAIIKALRQSFAELEAWKPGYVPMLRTLLAGKGHSPELAGKQRQQDPGHTGCTFTDDVLLPALRENRRFLDQECLTDSNIMIFHESPY